MVLSWLNELNKSNFCLPRVAKTHIGAHTKGGAAPEAEEPIFIPEIPLRKLSKVKIDIDIYISIYMYICIIIIYPSHGFK